MERDIVHSVGKGEDGANRFGHGIAPTVLHRCRDVTNHVRYLLNLSVSENEDASSHFVVFGKSMNVFFGDPSPRDTKQVVVVWRQEGINGTFRVCVGENEDLKLSLASIQTQVPSAPSSPSAASSSSSSTSLPFPPPPPPPPLNAALLTPSVPPPPPNRLAFNPEIHDLVIPFLLPYLPVYDKLYTMSLVCKSFLDVIRRNGAIERIDVNDGGEWAGRGYGNQNKYAFYPDHGGREKMKQSPTKKYSIRYIHGAVESSTKSLIFLALTDFKQFNFQKHFNPIVNDFERLKVVDFSGCTQVLDDTLSLIAENLGGTLEVLYLKGCNKVTDDGICAVAESCHGLRILEVNFVPMTDRAGIAIGDNLHNLEALYMRDNYLITNETVKAISEGCRKLTQLTLWGCIRVRIEEVSFTMNLKNLVMLNFWGCHYLQDDFARMLGGLESLRSLIVAECHNLGDAFLLDLCEYVPNVHHLNLRYLRKITGLALESIGRGFKQLYSLDVSFCVKLTETAVGGLLFDLPSLNELRLFSCAQLSVEGITTWWRATLISERSCLSILDLRGCIPPNSLNFLTEKDTSPDGEFRAFDELTENYFTRDARWGGEEGEEEGVKDFLKEHTHSKALMESYVSFGSSNFLRGLGSGIISNTNLVLHSPQIVSLPEGEEGEGVIGLEL